MRKSLALLTILLLFSESANGVVEHQPKPKLCNILFNSDIVVHARVAKVENVFHKDDSEGAPDLKYTLDVLKSYRGKTGRRLVVVSEMGVEQVSLIPGKEYIVFAGKMIDGINYIWDLQAIQESKGSRYSRELESKIQQLLTEKTSSIEGEVRDKNWNLVSGMTLTIVGNGTSKGVTVDKNGSFYIKVDPGFYQFIIPNNLSVTSYSTDGMSPDPHNLKIAPQSLEGGQCMQIQLQEK